MWRAEKRITVTRDRRQKELLGHVLHQMIVGYCAAKQRFRSAFGIQNHVTLTAAMLQRDV